MGIASTVNKWCVVPTLRCAVILALAGVSVNAGEKLAKAPGFEADVLPVFAVKCNRCHGEQRRGGKLDMRSMESLLKGGVSGPAIKPGNAEKSLLIEMVHYDEMPPRKEQPRVTADELKMLRAWVDGLGSK